jgi:hypothetical protein
MSDNSMVLVVVGYQDVATAQHDFDAMIPGPKAPEGAPNVLIVQLRRPPATPDSQEAL